MDYISRAVQCTVWEKIRDGLQSIVERIERWMAGLSPESDLGKIGQKMAQENREILDRFVAGIRAASENAAYIKNTTDEGGVRMEMARYAKQGGKYSYALTDKEWGIFYASTMKGNQRSSFRIGNDGVVLLGDKFSKVVYYEDVDGDIEVKAVYKVENYDYNIHENKPNAYETLIVRERLKDRTISQKERDRIEKQTRAILERNSALYGAVFSKYNGQSHRFNIYSRGGSKTGQNSSAKANGTGVSGETGKARGIKYQSRDDEYLSAVNRGDMQTAQRMVDEAAKAVSGYRIAAQYGRRHACHDRPIAGPKKALLSTSSTASGPPSPQGEG